MEVGRPEILQARARLRGRQHRRGGQLHRLGFAPGKGSALRLIQLRLRQILDADVLAHACCQPTIE